MVSTASCTGRASACVTCVSLRRECGTVRAAGMHVSRIASANATLAAADRHARHFDAPIIVVGALLCGHDGSGCAWTQVAAGPVALLDAPAGSD